jgi:hypothetical protein
MKPAGKSDRCLHAPATDDPDQNSDDRDHKKNVDESAGVISDKSYKPSYYKDHGDDVQQVSHNFGFIDTGRMSCLLKKRRNFNTVLNYFHNVSHIAAIYGHVMIDPKSIHSGTKQTVTRIQHAHRQ